MKGLFFVHLSENPEVPRQVNIRTGIVKDKVGSERWLLEFDSQGRKFANVFSAEQLERFAFFNSAADRAGFLDELIASQTRAAQPEAPLVPMEPPAPVEPAA